jgi:hypothetical protein
MEPAHYTDPLEEALSHGSQRVAQVAALVAAMAQVAMQHRALENAKRATDGDEAANAVLGGQERLLRHQTRLAWAPAHDPDWLSEADLLQTAKAWASAVTDAGTDPAAASAQRKCEERMRTLHPYAMARYDRLRNDGMSPLDAMREAAPLFGRSPTVRTGDPGPARRELAADTGQQEHPGEGQAQRNQTDPNAAADNRAEQRGRQIVARLQTRARAAGRPELGPDELALVLEELTNLPSHVIDTLTRQRSNDDGRAHNEENRAAAAERARAADLDTATDLPSTVAVDERTSGLTAAHRDTALADVARAHASTDRTAAQLAAESFPHAASEAVRSASAQTTRRATRVRTQTQTAHETQRPKRNV